MRQSLQKKNKQTLYKTEREESCAKCDTKKSLKIIPDMIDKIRQTVLDSHRISMTFRLQMFVKVFEYIVNM